MMYPELFANLTFIKESRARSKNMLITLTTSTIVDALKKEQILNYINESKKRYLEKDLYLGCDDSYLSIMLTECISEIDNTKFTEISDFFYEFEANNENEDEDALEKFNLYLCRMKYILRLIYIIDTEFCNMYHIDQ